MEAPFPPRDWRARDESSGGDPWWDDPWGARFGELVEEVRSIALGEDPGLFRVDFDAYIRTRDGGRKFGNWLTEYYRRLGAPIYWTAGGPDVPRSAP